MNQNSLENPSRTKEQGSNVAKLAIPLATSLDKSKKLERLQWVEDRIKDIEFEVDILQSALELDEQERKKAIDSLSWWKDVAIIYDAFLRQKYQKWEDGRLEGEHPYENTELKTSNDKETIEGIKWVLEKHKNELEELLQEKRKLKTK